MNVLKSQTVFLHLVLLLSGAAGLGYEMVWTRMLMVGLGHEIIAVLAVIAAFFSGLALGAWTLDSFISQSREPDVWYAVLEFIIGFWALLLTLFIPAANAAAHYLIGIDPAPLHHVAVAFLLPLILLLPATFCMGATLPAIERFLIHLRQQARPVGGLYAANTCGAVLGTLATAYVLAPQLGLTKTIIVLAGLNFACSAVMLLGPAKGTALLVPKMRTTSYKSPPFTTLGTLLLTGLLGIGFEVVAIRVLSQVFENTVFSFASILTVYLLGTAAGAALYQVGAPQTSYNKTLHYLLSATSALCLVSLLLLYLSDAIYPAVRTALGSNFFASVAAEIATAGLVFFLPSAAMGATFSHLAQTASTHRGGLGRALGLNTLGASLAPVLFGIVMLPVLGSKNSLLIIACSYACLAAAIKRSRLIPAALIGFFAVVVFFSPVQLRFVSVPAGGAVLEYREGIMAAVSVVEDARGDRFLKVNDKFQMGSTATAFADKRLAHIPLLLHPHPGTALFLGLGTATTFAAAADHPGLRADGVELIPEIVPLLHYFEKSTGNFSQHETLHITIADARRFVNASPRKYDVVIADLFHPARDGAGALYTSEHFTAIRDHLNSGGIFCQWLPLYQLDSIVLRTIIRTFISVYPESQAYLAYYSLDKPILGLVGGTAPLRYSSDWFIERIGDSSLQQQLITCRLNTLYELLGGFIASGAGLATIAGDGPLNIDNLPFVTFNAPRFVYAVQQQPYRCLMELLALSHPAPEQVLTLASTIEQQQVHQRLANYWIARDMFLKAGIGVPQTNDLRLLLQYVKKPLLTCVTKSQDFSAAYEPLLSMARNLFRIDRSAALQLLNDLDQANPQRADAKLLRTYLAGN